jgi:hypothetical protein
LFPSRPPPTDRKILEKIETDRAEIFGEKISEKWDLQPGWPPIDQSWPQARFVNRAASAHAAQNLAGPMVDS